MFAQLRHSVSVPAPARAILCNLGRQNCARSLVGSKWNTLPCLNQFLQARLKHVSILFCEFYLYSLGLCPHSIIFGHVRSLARRCTDEAADGQARIILFTSTLPLRLHDFLPVASCGAGCVASDCARRQP